MEILKKKRIENKYITQFSKSGQNLELDFMYKKDMQIANKLSKEI